MMYYDSYLTFLMKAFSGHSPPFGCEAFRETASNKMTAEPISKNYYVTIVILEVW